MAGQAWRTCAVNQGRRKGEVIMYRRRPPMVYPQLQPLRLQCMLLNPMNRRRGREREERREQGGGERERARERENEASAKFHPGNTALLHREGEDH